LDDSKSDILTPDWVEQRPPGSGADWYFFGCGTDYKGALNGLTATNPYVRRGNVATVTVGPTVGRFAWQLGKRKIVLELPDLQNDALATVNGVSVSTEYRQSDCAVIVTTAANITDTITFTVRATAESPADIKSAQTLRRMGEVEGSSFTGAVRDALAAATRLDEPTRDAAMACAGIGLVGHDQSAYLYKGKIVNEFYCPPGIADGDQATNKLRACNSGRHRVYQYEYRARLHGRVRCGFP